MVVRRLSMDFDLQTLKVESADGSEETSDMPSKLLTEEPQIRRVAFDLVSHELVITLPDGEDVTVEIGSPGSSDLPSADRPIVYLDQLHWVTLAQQLWAPDKVADRDRASAVKLIELARARAILLPLSSANLVETARTDGRHRRHMATTMLDLSRGWQMRNPVEVRAREVQAALTGSRPLAREVFTLEPDVIFAERVGSPERPADFPPEWRELHRRLTSVTAIYAAMIEDEKMDLGDGPQKARAWANSHHELALYMREHGTSKEHARLNARGRLLSDLGEEIAAVAQAEQIDNGEFRAWLDHSVHDGFGSMPYVGRVEEILFHRLRNADDRWEANDLFDMHFLSCAAGYADVVVGEKKTSEYLGRAAGRVAGGAFVCRTLPAALEHLDTLDISEP